MVKIRQVLSDPIITESPGGIKLDWYHEDEAVFGASIERLTESSKGIFGEFNFRHIMDEFPPVRHLYTNLRSPLARKSVVKRLVSLKLPVEFNWESLVDQVCDLAIDSLRKESPIGNINIQAEDIPPIDYLLYPILIRNEPTTIYGAGGFGKSLLADLLAVMVQFNIAELGWLVNAGNVLYLDWETNIAVHQNYIQAIKAGMGIEDNTPILYRFCERDLVDDIREIHKVVVDNKIDLVIIDSQMAATSNPRPGLDASQSASAYYNALRTLHTTTLTIDHITKEDMSGFGHSDSAYGSVVKYNRTRKQFLVKRTQEPGDDFIELSLVNKKFNLGKIHKPIGIRIDFFENGNEKLEKISFNDCHLEDNPILAKALPIWQRVSHELKFGSMTIKELAEELSGTTEAVIRTTLNGRKNMFVKLEDMKWGLLNI